MRTRGKRVTDTQAHITGGAQHEMKTGRGVFDQQRLRTSRRQPHYTGWGALDTWSAHFSKGSPPGVCPLLSLAGPGMAVDPQGSTSGSSGRCYSRRPGDCPSIHSRSHVPTPPLHKGPARLQASPSRPDSLLLESSPPLSEWAQFESLLGISLAQLWLISAPGPQPFNLSKGSHPTTVWSLPTHRRFQKMLSLWHQTLSLGHLRLSDGSEKAQKHPWVHVSPCVVWRLRPWGPGLPETGFQAISQDLSPSGAANAQKQ